MYDKYASLADRIEAAVLELGTIGRCWLPDEQSDEIEAEVKKRLLKKLIVHHEPRPWDEHVLTAGEFDSDELERIAHKRMDIRNSSNNKPLPR